MELYNEMCQEFLRPSTHATEVYMRVLLDWQDNKVAVLNLVQITNEDGIPQFYQSSVVDHLNDAVLLLKVLKNGGPPADLLINQGVRDNVSGHTTRGPPGRVRTDNQTVPALCHGH